MTPTTENRLYRVPQESAGERLDRWLASQPGAGTRSQLEQAIEDGRVRVNGARAKRSRRVRAGDEVCLQPEAPAPASREPLGEALPLDVLYEDEAMLAVNKAPGMVVHPAVGHRSGTLVHALLHYAPAACWPGTPERAGIVHRLDRDTSGVLLVARTVEAHEALARQFRRRTVAKEYLALVRGAVREPGRIDEPIGRHPRDRKRMSTSARRSRSALTEYEPLEGFGAATLLAVRLHTGRTHQIRVHLASRGWPVVGDPVYGRRKGAVKGPLALMPRQALHAWRIGFEHPVSGERLQLEAPLPEDFSLVLAELRRAKDC